MNRMKCVGIGLGMVFIWVSMLSAQVTTGAISGTVGDATGAVVPRASVVIRHIETGLTRTVASDEAGRYRVPNLPLGSYEVEASHSGFQTEVRKGIQLTVGREAVVNLELKVGAVAERVEVTGEASLVETTTASTAYLVDDKKIRDLPLNGRSYTQLAVLQPGVVSFGLRQTDVSAGHGQQISVAGAQPGQNSFLLDGQDVNDYAGRTPGSASDSNLGIDAIREFSILTNKVSAEYGLVTGGVINVVTNSGTNNFRGSAFEFLRNSALDAKNFFDKAQDPIPPFKRNQFGATYGGPVKKDRAFFLGAYEGLRERLGQTLLSPVPNAQAHQGFLPAPAGGERFVGIHPEIQVRMALLPLPNGRDFGDGTGELISNPIQPTREDYLLGRVDYRLSDKDTLYGRYVYDQARVRRPEQIPIFAEQKRTRFQYFTLNWTRVISPSVVNEARVAFNRSLGEFQGLDLVPVPTAQLSIIRGRSLASPWRIDSPLINTGSLGGQYVETPRRFVNNVFEFANNMSHMRGGHTLKWGAIFKPYYANPQNNFGFRGWIVFSSLENFMRGIPFTTNGQDVDSQLSWQQKLFGWFVQDDIRLRRNLTLNLGIRHEFTTDPEEKHGRIANLRRITDPAVTPGELFRIPKDTFAPRVGLAWDVLGDGKMALRAGAGVFHEQFIPVVTRYTYTAMFPFVRRFTIVNPGSLTIDLRDVPAGAGNPNIFEFEPNVPTRYQWNLDLQREIVGGTTVSAAYVGSRSLHNSVRKEANSFIPQILPDGRKFFPATGLQRRIPFFAAIGGHTWDSTADYHSLQLSVIRRFSRGLQYQGSYTWSRNVDLQSAQFALQLAGNGTMHVMDPDDLKRDRGLSAYDLHHLFTSNATYDLPLGRNLTGAAGHVLKGWQVNGLLTLRTGFPFNITTGFSRSRDGQVVGPPDRPDLRPGASNNPVTGTTAGCLEVPAGQKLGTADRYFDSCAFELPEAGTYGNLGRMTVIGPGLVNLDLSITKTFTLTERSNLQFRAEFFNLFNRPNFGNFVRTIFTGTAARNGSAGRILDTLTTSRQIQFGLKLSF